MTAPTCPLCDAPVPASVVSGPPTTVFRCDKCTKVLTWRNGKAMASASAMRARAEKSQAPGATPTPPPAPSPGAPSVGAEPSQAATQLISAVSPSNASEGKPAQAPLDAPATATQPLGAAPAAEQPGLKVGLPLAEVLTSPEVPAIRLPETLPQPAPPGLSRLGPAGPPASQSVFLRHKVPIGAALGVLVLALIGFAVFGGGDSKEGEAEKPATTAEAPQEAPKPEPAVPTVAEPPKDDAAAKEAAEKAAQEAAVNAELTRREAEKAAKEAAAKEAADKRAAEKAAKEAAAKEAADKRAAEKAAKEAAAKEAADKRAAEKAAKADAARTASAGKSEPAKAGAAPAKEPSGPTLGGKPVVLEYDDGPDKRTPVPAGSEAAVQKARAAFQAGNKKLFANDAAGAIASYQAALKAYPGFVGAYRGIGLALVQQKENEKAIAVFKLYVKNAPGAKDADLIKKVIAKLEKG